MTFIGLGPIQKAVYTRLSEDEALLTRVTEVTDSVSKTYPYVYIGDKTEIRFDTFDRRGHEDTITLHVYTQDSESGAAGNKLGESILEDIAVLLCSTALVIEGHEAVLCDLEFADTLTGDDGITRDTIGRFRIIAQDS